MPAFARILNRGQTLVAMTLFTFPLCPVRLSTPGMLWARHWYVWRSQWDSGKNDAMLGQVS
jgi:hypothetical protein